MNEKLYYQTERFSPQIKPAVNQAEAKARNIAILTGTRLGIASVLVHNGEDVATVYVNEVLDSIRAIERAEAD